MITCPNCKSPKSKVADSRNFKIKNAIYRRRKCINCESFFNTQEIILKPKENVIKTKKTQSYKKQYFSSQSTMYEPRYNGINAVYDD
jgi:transcriptional regulator NrdR family protein